MKSNIPHAPAELAQLLRRLHAESGLNVSQHTSYPRPDEWFGGDWGPFTTAEDAIVNGVRWLASLYDTAAHERDELEEENRRLRVALDALQAERLHRQ
jgi:hypothetical protein